MVRKLLLLWGMLIGPACFGAEALYLSNAEKALIGIVLKSAQEIAIVDGTLNLASQQKHIQQHKDKLIEIANLFKIYQETEPTTISVTSYEDFLKAQAVNPIFQEYRLDEVDPNNLLELVKPVRFQSDSLKVQRKIDAYEALRVRSIQTFFATLGLQSLKLSQLQNLNLQDVKDQIKSIFNSKVDELTRNLIGHSSLHVKILEKLLKAYFKNLPDYQKIEILYRISHMSFDSKPLDILLTMLQNSGPQMQKLIQIMGRSEHVPAEFQEAFQRLESHVQPVPWWKVRRALLQQNVNLEGFTYLERTPVGVGTMAQTHRAQYLDEAKERQSVVIRFLKPDIEKYLEMDHQILKIVSAEIDTDPELKEYNLPPLADLVEDLHDSVVEELNVQATLAQQKTGQKIYSRSAGVVSFNGQKNLLRFQVPDARMYSNQSDVMIQELVYGKKPTKEFQLYKEIYPDLYRAISEKIAEMWLEEAFFKSGFFHADLHQGNLLASYSDHEMTVAILDFGMTGQLHTQLRESALLLALGIKLNRADLIAEHFLKLGKMNNPNVKGSELSRRVQSRIDQMKIEPGLGGSLEAWTAWALDQGLELEYEFLKLNRGLTAIEGLLSDSKSMITTERLAERIALKNKAYVTRLLLKEPNLPISDYGRLVLSLFGEQEKNKISPTLSLRCEALFR